MLETLRASATGKKPVWRTLYGILKPERAHLAGAAIALSITSAGTLAFPYFTGRILDGFAVSGSSSGDWLSVVNENMLACSGALALVGIGGFARAYLLETASEKISRRMRLDLLISLLKRPQSFLDSAKTGDLVSRLGTDVTRVSRSVMDGAFGFRVLLNAAAGTVMVAKTVPLVLLPKLLAPVAIMFAGGVVYGRLVRGISKQHNEAQSRGMQVAEENLSLIRLVKLFNGEQRALTDYGNALSSVYALTQANALATGGRVTAFVAIGGGFILHVIYNCGMLISSGTLTIGETSALAGYLLICGNAYQGLVQSYGDIQKALGASDRLIDLISANEPVRPVNFSSSLSTSSISVKFSNVDFKYSAASDRLVLNNLSLCVPSGANQAIVGLSGCGKSTVLSLIARIYEPTLGSIHINDTNIACIDPFELRENILAIVPQETSLFNTSIGKNISYPHDAASLDEARLVKSARLDFVSDWHNTVVGDRGLSLSGGERQRIAIARALRRPEKPLLLLDEATSALDHESDAEILNNLKSLNSTKIAVTHRMSAILWSDRLTVLDAGHNVQEGPTQELLRNPGPVLKRLLAQLDY